MHPGWPYHRWTALKIGAKAPKRKQGRPQLARDNTVSWLKLWAAGCTPKWTRPRPLSGLRCVIRVLVSSFYPVCKHALQSSSVLAQLEEQRCLSVCGSRHLPDGSPWNLYRNSCNSWWWWWRGGGAAWLNQHCIFFQRHHEVVLSSDICSQLRLNPSHWQ